MSWSQPTRYLTEINCASKWGAEIFFHVRGLMPHPKSISAGNFLKSENGLLEIWAAQKSNFWAATREALSEKKLGSTTPKNWTSNNHTKFLCRYVLGQSTDNQKPRKALISNLTFAKEKGAIPMYTDSTVFSVQKSVPVKGPFFGGWESACGDMRIFLRERRQDSKKRPCFELWEVACREGLK